MGWFTKKEKTPEEIEEEKQEVRQYNENHGG
jgi:hypothetical protein